MIVVIADDLAGAAEIGGVAFRYGLTTLVETEMGVPTDADLVVADTDSRSCTPEEAARRAGKAAALYGAETVDGIFKKVDSVLRGQVVAELGALIEACGRDRALLVPANPGLGRTISDGRYYVRGRPLHETDFARDPEHPAATSDVLDILGSSKAVPIRIARPGQALPEGGIVVGEACTGADLAAWARAADRRTLPAGAAEFFGAFLGALGHRPADGASGECVPPGRGAALFVCGSTSDQSRSFCRGCESRGIAVLRMPLDLLDARMCPGALIRGWTDEALRALEARPRAVVAIDRPLRREPGLPQVLSDHLGAVVERVLERAPVGHLFVEGGATAATLVRRFGWSRFRVRQEFAPGVVCMQVEGEPGPLLTMKPGSYAWPGPVLALLE